MLRLPFPQTPCALVARRARRVRPAKQVRSPRAAAAFGNGPVGPILTICLNWTYSAAPMLGSNGARRKAEGRRPATGVHSPSQADGVSSHVEPSNGRFADADRRGYGSLQRPRRRAAGTSYPPDRHRDGGRLLVRTSRALRGHLTALSRIGFEPKARRIAP